MTSFERYFLLGLSYMIGLGVIVSYANPTLFVDHFVHEDKTVEWLGFSTLVLSSVICLQRFFQLKEKDLLFRLSLLAGAALFFFGAGEEISWGQRIFDYNVPQFFQDHNAQGETNLHNLIVADRKVNKVIFGTGLSIVIIFYLMILPWLYTSSKKVKDFVGRFAVPICRPHHFWSYLALFLICSLSPSSRKGELIEFGGTSLFLLILLNPLNKDLFASKHTHS